VWDGIVATSVLLGLLLNVTQVHFNIAIDPNIDLDPKLISQQGFTVTINGPVTLYKVHYSCRFTITKSVSNQGHSVDIPMSSAVEQSSPNFSVN